MSLDRFFDRTAFSHSGKRFYTLLLPGVFAVLFAAVGISGKAETKHNDVFTPGMPDEGRLAQQVRHALLMLPYYGVFDDLAFRVDGDSVILMGKVTNPTLKSDAENAAKHIEGVNRVVNEIEVLPPSPMDDRIRMAEYRAIYGDPVLSTRYGFRSIPPIHIIVDNGHVTLTGVVANEADKNLIGIRANSVPGVFSVTNDLQVEKS